MSLARESSLLLQIAIFIYNYYNAFFKNSLNIFMRYKAEYDEFSETNKFLDELFQEDCEIGWEAEQPQTNTNNALNITVVKQEGEAEMTYLAQLASEMGQKITEILDKADSLPTDRDRGITLTKEELVSRLIGISNSLDMLICDMEDAAGQQAQGSAIIVGGGCPFNGMF